MKLGLYGGTFDPIHAAHLIIAEQARQDFLLDTVLFMPCANPPHKEAHSTSPAHHRFQMVQLAVADNPFFRVSDLEMKRQGTSFTVITLEEIARRYHLSSSELYLIMGADSLLEIATWRDPEKIFSLCSVIVAGRPLYDLDADVPAYAQKYLYCNAPMMEISSTTVRSMVQAKRSIKYLVPGTVEQYIQQHHLYA